MEVLYFLISDLQYPSILLLELNLFLFAPQLHTSMWFLFIINLACCIVNNWSVSGYYNIFGIDSTAIRSFATA